ncbi:unnamed protein product [Peronospora destructor]|uniref:Nucleolar protein 14 n=1 Tax=Peronospora destructor TaxID=86335 RepID=A0AAV0TIN5_9STRA|nr:unnamed protein product [Peronospora destructor]
MSIKKGGGKKLSCGKKQKHGFVRASSSRGGNPFDTRSNATKQKHVVIGCRVKGTGRNVLAARAEAERKRHKTLGAEFKARNKSNVFKDKRLGEQDLTLSMEDKMMARFQTERKRKMRNASMFVLHDSDSEQEENDDALFLTHKGTKIGADDDYDILNVDRMSDEEVEDEEGRKMDRDIVNKLHFGGGKGDVDAPKTEEGDGKRKTHKEVMQEVMMKAKLYKAERQKNKNSQEDATDKLDQGFADLRGLLEFRPTRANGKDVIPVQMDDFDKLTRELVYEAKAKATERRMSPEETAAKERDRLAQLEKKRVLRMHGADADDIDSDDAGKRMSKKDKRKAKKGKTPQLIMMPPTDDDLTDVYAVDDRFAADAEEEKMEDAEDGDDSKELDESEEEEFEADFVEDSDVGDEEKVTNEEARKKEEEEEEIEVESDEEMEKQKRLQDAEKAAAELPFVFDCPESPEELATIFKKHARKSFEKRGLILERIVTYYNPRLSVENKSKMKRFFAVTVRQFLIFAEQHAAHKHDLDLLAKTMYTIAQQMGDTAAMVVRELLAQLYRRLHKRATISAWPTLPQLLLFKALTCIFPTSDLRHNVISPSGDTARRKLSSWCVNAVVSKLHTRLEFCWKARRPLCLQSFAPTTLPTFAPQFDENYTVRKDKTAPKDTAQLKQLQRQVKRARKSAARELRRDAEFLHREKQKEEEARLAAKEEKQKEIRRWVEDQNATFNQQVRKGGNMLKGGGSARGPAPRARNPKM